MSSPTLHKRFIEERIRLGHATGLSLASALEVVPSTISKIERGVATPSAGLLAAFAEIGADAGYVLTGRRTGSIDLNLLGMSEASLRVAYDELRPGRSHPGAIRSRMTALVYNRVVGRIGADLDEARALRDAAKELLLSIDDPAAVDMLERNLFTSAAQDLKGSGVVVQGDRNRVAGRDMVVGKARKQPTK